MKKPILVIEDDDAILRGIADAVKHAGYQALQADDGETGRDMAVKVDCDLVLLDLALPQLDGFGVLTHLREAGQEVPTIVLTALDDPVFEQRLKDLGATQVFRKFELIVAAGERNATQVREILTPVLAANPSEVSREAGLLATGGA